MQWRASKITTMKGRLHLCHCLGGLLQPAVTRRAYFCVPMRKRAGGNSSKGSHKEGESNGGNKKSVTFGFCDKKGHADNSCWLKPGKTMSMVRNHNKEQVSMIRSAAPLLRNCYYSVGRPSQTHWQKMLEDPNVWIPGETQKSPDQR
jgi:hypothetical protein